MLKIIDAARYLLKHGVAPGTVLHGGMFGRPLSVCSIKSQRGCHVYSA